MKYTKIYNINNLEDLKASEKKLNSLLNKYRYVRILHVGVDKIKIEYC